MCILRINDHAIESGHYERKMPDIVQLGKITLAKPFTLDTVISRNWTNFCKLCRLCRIVTPVYCRHVIMIGL
jgi:hypothetical protein